MPQDMAKRKSLVSLGRTEEATEEEATAWHQTGLIAHRHAMSPSSVRDTGLKAWLQPRWGGKNHSPPHSSPFVSLQSMSEGCWAGL